MHINILTGVQYWDSILKEISPSKRQQVLVTSTKICISTEIASLQPTPEYKYILKTTIPGRGRGGRWREGAGERQVPNTQTMITCNVVRGQKDKKFKITDTSTSPFQLVVSGSIYTDPHFRDEQEGKLSILIYVSFDCITLQYRC